MFFDNNGRCLAELTNFPVYKNSRNYFSLDKDIKDKVDLKNIYLNYNKNYNLKINVSFEEFQSKINNISKSILSNEKIKNINNGVGFPFIIPKLDNPDIGSNLKDIFIPALKKSYLSKFPNYDFINHIKDDLSNKIDTWKDSRYQKILSASKEKDIIGILYPCLNEFSFPAANDIIKKLPNNLILSGGYEIFSALIGTPDLLFKEDKYPPLLWFSSMKNNKDENLSYHIESYGYNLTLNERAHLNQAAEYWWHSLSVIG